jgi:2-polyprenyl-3-methyl-5-hydroxy-6-metoxy-1,4-benzoquinol methylase
MLDTFLKTYFQHRPLFLGLIRAKELELFRRFLPAGLSSPGYRILDFGCGDGFFSRTLLNGRGTSLTAADRADTLAVQGEEGGRYKHVTRAAGESLPFKNDSFDLIMSNSVLEHVEDVQHTMQELARILKRRGTVLCSVMTERWETYLLGGAWLGQSYAAWLRRRQEHKHLLAAGEWRARFEQAGLHPRTVIGYMDKRASRWLELAHYLSAPALVSHRLFGRWVLFPFLFDLFPLHRLLAPLVSDDIPVEDGAALFFVLDKTA